MDHQKKSIRKDALFFYIKTEFEEKIKNQNKIKRRIELIVHLLRSKRDKKYGICEANEQGRALLILRWITKKRVSVRILFYFICNYIFIAKPKIRTN